MARVAGVDSVQELCAVLKKSGLLTPDQLEQATKLAAEGGDLKSIARRWVKSGHLTAWQAGQILGGRTDNLHVGKYRILDQLGSVGLGRVYLAQHATMNRRVALKVLAKRYSDADSIDRFLSQVRRLAALDHRNIIQVYDVDQDKEKGYYLVKEYMDGRDLQKQVQKSGPLAPRDAADLIRQTAAGLDYAHRKDQFHGSMGPRDLIVDPSGNLKILNLGLAHLADPVASARDVDEEVVQFPLPGSAPDAEPSAEADLFGLGGTLWFLLAGDGKLPTGKDSPDAIAAALRKRRAEVPAELAAICGKLLSRSAGYAKVGEAEQALNAWLATQPKSGVKQPEPEAPAVAKAPPRAAPAAARKLATAAAIDAPAATAEAASDESPSVSINLNLGAKPTASGGPTFTGTPPAPPADFATPTAPPATTAAPGTIAGLPMPMVLAIGGGGVALLLLIGVGAYFLFGGKKEPEVAKGPEKNAAAPKDPGKTTPKKTDDPDDPDAAPASTGTKKPSTTKKPKPMEPEVLDPEKSPPAEANPVAPPVGPKPEEPKPADSKPEEPKPTEPAPAEPKPTEPAPPAEPKPPEPAPPAEPKPEEPKPTEPPAAKPLAAFPGTVELPIAGKPAPGAASATEPVKLGDIPLVASDIAIIQLIGGDKALPAKSKLTFTLAAGNNGLADRDWEIRIAGGAKDDANKDGPVVAKLSHRENQLKFQWAEAALTDDNANYLRNCVLLLKMAGDEKFVALRPSVTFDAYPINLEKPAPGRVEIKLDYPPDASALRLEILPLEGLADQRVEDNDKMPSLERTTKMVVLGKGETETLMYKLDTAMTKKSLAITVTPHFKLAIDETWQRLLPASVKKAYTIVVGANAQLLAESQRIEKLPENQRAQAGKATVDLQMGKTQLAIRQFDTLKAFSDTLTGKAYLHFKLHYTCGDQSVLLAQSQIPAEPMGRGGPKRPMPMEEPKKLDLGPEQE